MYHAVLNVYIVRLGPGENCVLCLLSPERLPPPPSPRLILEGSGHKGHCSGGLPPPRLPAKIKIKYRASPPLLQAALAAASTYVRSFGDPGVTVARELKGPGNTRAPTYPWSQGHPWLKIANPNSPELGPDCLGRCARSLAAGPHRGETHGRFLINF